MPPRIEKETFEYDPKEGARDELNNSVEPTSVSTLETKDIPEFKPQIVWRNVIIFIILHLGTIYGAYCCFHAKRETLILGKLFIKA